jgi:hypothetical protein
MRFKPNFYHLVFAVVAVLVLIAIATILDGWLGGVRI